ncbi:hypothetical protein ZWY2020_051034, partial [Hordeum vulgare]
VANEMINRTRTKIAVLIPRFIGVNVEYTREGNPPQRVIVLKLCEEKLCTFIGFSTEGDKLMLKESSLEINPNKYVDMQRKWRVPFVGGKRSHSLGVVADSVIHPLYKHMKYKINSEEDHKLWGISLLPDYLIEYGAIDAYATYESWKRIKNMAEGLECSKEKEAEAKEDNDYGYYYGGF